MKALLVTVALSLLAISPAISLTVGLAGMMGGRDKEY